MIPTIEAPPALEPVAELGDDEVGREYEELSELEDLDARAAPTGGEGSPLHVAAELARVGEELEAIATLEDRAELGLTRMAEAETTEDRIARRFEGMDVDELDALAHWDEGAETRELPDDEVERGADLLG